MIDASRIGVISLAAAPAAADAAAAAGRPEPEEARAKRVDSLIKEAARLAVDLGLPPEVFTGAAFHAYMEANPALREKLEQNQLREQLEELRRRGQVGEA